MNGVYKHYVIDLSCNNNFVQVPAVQGDGNNVRGFEVELISNNVQYVVDAKKVIVSIAGTKPDTKQILNECEVTEEGFILVDITSQMTAVAGRGDYSITLMDRETNALLQSFPFYILVTKSAFNANEIVSSNEFQLLTRTIMEAEKATADIRDLEVEFTANEDGRKQAESDRVIAEDSRVQAEIAREQAEQKRQTDTATAIQNANNATADAITATNNANQATNDALDATADAITATQNTNAAITNANNATTDAIDATTQIQAVEQSITNAEATRVRNENDRIANETQRQQDTQTAISNVNTAVTNANNAATRADDIRTDLENKVASGYFNGRDGVITTVEMNQMAFNVDSDGNLILTFEDGNTDAQKFSITGDGDLIYTLS